MERRNPYERRGQSALAAMTDIAFGGRRPGFELVPGPAALQREDLDAAIASAYRRGRRDAEIERDEKYREEIHRAQLNAWDEGHDGGAVEGWAALVGWIDEQFGERLKALHEMGRERIELVRQYDAQGESAAAALAESNALQGLTELTRDLRAAIEQHFPRPE